MKSTMKFVPLVALLAACTPQIQPALVARPIGRVAHLTVAPYVGSQDLTCRDVGIYLTASDTFVFLRGVTADQAQRDAMQHKALLCASEGAWEAQQTPCAAMARKSAMSAMLNLVTTRLGGADYEGKLCRNDETGPGHYSNCDWTVIGKGRHYAVATLEGAKVAACLVGNPAAVACAKLSQASLDYYDLQVVDGRCVRRNSPVPDHEPYNEAVGESGALSTRVVIPPLSANDKMLLHATHEAHKWVSDYQCGRRPDAPPAGIVSKTHKAYEDVCGSDPTCRHFRQMKVFSGRVHPGWSKVDECTIRDIQDAAHMTWMADQEKPEPATGPPYHRWIDARLDGDDTHLKSHFAANWKDKPTCATATGASSGCFVLRPVCAGKLANCKVMSPELWVQQWRATHPALNVSHPAPEVM